MVPTPRQLRALTHPIRLRMLGLLRTEGPATSTGLAQRLELNTGLTSYHLRQLAEHGFIEEEAARGSGRERWWRATATTTRTESPEMDDVEAVDAHQAFLQAVATVHAETMQRGVEELALVPADWQRASTFSDWTFRLTPARARALVDHIQGFLDAAEDEDAADALDFAVQVHAFPLRARRNPKDEAAR